MTSSLRSLFCMYSLFHLPALSPSCPFSCQCHFSVFGKLQRTSGSSVQNSYFHRALNAFWLLMMKPTCILFLLLNIKWTVTNKISTTYVLRKTDNLNPTLPAINFPFLQQFSGNLEAQLLMCDILRCRCDLNGSH